MCRANGSRLGGPHVPPSPSLRIETGLHTRTTRATAALLGPCFKTGRMQPTAGQATTAQGVGRPPGRTDQPGPDTAGSDATRSSNGRERPGRWKRTCATGVEVPPLSSAGFERSARPAVSSPPSPRGRPRYLPDARSSPGARRTWPAQAAESAGTREASTHGRPTGVPTARGTPRGPLNSTRAGSAACVSLPTVSRPL